MVLNDFYKIVNLILRELPIIMRQNDIKSYERFHKAQISILLKKTDLTSSD